MTNVKSAPDHSEVLRLLSSTPLFAGMPVEILRSMSESARLLRAEAGKMLFREGDTASSFLLVLHGCVEVLRFTADGDEHVFSVFREGQLVAEAAMFMPHHRYPMNARSQTPAEYFRLSGAALRSACEKHSILATRMLENLSLRLYRQVNEVDWLTASSASERLAVYLLELHQHQGENLQLPINLRQLAIHLGIRPESLSRLLSDWQKAGYIQGRLRRWTLCDLAYLQRLACTAARNF